MLVMCAGMEVLNRAIESILNSTDRDEWEPTVIHVTDNVLSLWKGQVTFSLSQGLFSGSLLHLPSDYLFTGGGWAFVGMSGTLSHLSGCRPRQSHLRCDCGWRHTTVWVSRVLVWARRWKLVWSGPGRLYGEFKIKDGIKPNKQPISTPPMTEWLATLSS